MEMKHIRFYKKILKWRTRSLKIAFPVLIIEDILTGKKPHELAPWEDMSGVAVIGVFLIVAGALIRSYARGYFERGRLFTTGPYALVRHPLYIGSFLVVSGVLFILNDWLNWVVVMPLFFFFHIIAIVYEESSLAERFGQQWQQYASQVPLIIPSFHSLFSRNFSTKWNRSYYLSTGEKYTFTMMITIPFFIEIIEELFFKS